MNDFFIIQKLFYFIQCFVPEDVKINSNTWLQMHVDAVEVYCSRYNEEKITGNPLVIDFYDIQDIYFEWSEENDKVRQDGLIVRFITEFEN